MPQIRTIQIEKKLQKILEDLKKQSFSDKAKKFIGKIGKGLLKETSRALAVSAKTLLGGLGSVAEGLGDAILSRTDGPGAILEKSCKVAEDATKGEKGSELMKNIERAYGEFMDQKADHQGLAKGTFAMKQAGLARSINRWGSEEKSELCEQLLGEAIARSGASLISGSVGVALKGVGMVANGLAAQIMLTSVVLSMKVLQTRLKVESARVLRKLKSL